MSGTFVRLADFFLEESREVPHWLFLLAFIFQRFIVHQSLVVALGLLGAGDDHRISFAEVGVLQHRIKEYLLRVNVLTRQVAANVDESFLKAASSRFLLVKYP